MGGRPRPRQCQTVGCSAIQIAALISVAEYRGKEGLGQGECKFKGIPNFTDHCPNCNKNGHTAFSKRCDANKREMDMAFVMKYQGILHFTTRKLLED